MLNDTVDNKILLGNFSGLGPFFIPYKVVTRLNA